MKMDLDFKIFTATKWQEIPRNVKFRELEKIERNLVVLTNWLVTAKENLKLELIIQLRILSLAKQQSELELKVWRNT